MSSDLLPLQESEIERACNPKPGDLFERNGRTIMVTSVDKCSVYFRSNSVLAGYKDGALHPEEWRRCIRITLANGATFKLNESP